MWGSKSSLSFALTIVLLAGSAVGVAAQDEAAATSPFELTAEWGFTSQGCCVTVEPASDPRFEGEVDATVSQQYPGGGLEVWSRAFTVVNEDGAWRGLPHTIIFPPDGTASTVTQVFIGEGAYAGSYAVIESDTTPGAPGGGVVLRGFIIDGEPPAQ